MPASQSAELETALPCPLCGYDLRGLPQGRCPECGHAFDPLQLRDAQRRAAYRPVPWLIEFPPPRRWGPVRNALLTQLLTLRPFWFWGRLRPSMRIEYQHLQAYAVFNWLFLTAAMLGALTVEPFATWIEGFAYYLVTLDQKIRLEQLRSAWGWKWGLGSRWLAAIPALFIIAAWPWLTLLFLSSFRASLRQARIAPGHLLRCVTYSADLGTPLAIFVLASSAFVGFGGRYPGELTDPEALLPPGGAGTLIAHASSMPVPILLMLIATLLWFTVRLGIAYRRYLAFPHAIATVISSQIILWLILVITWILLLLGRNP